MTARWRVLESRLVLDHPWLKVREERVLLPNGAEIERFHTMDGRDWSAVLAITEDRRVVLVEQYRHGIMRATLELPAGVIDTGETPLDAARRELLEETGYAADDYEPLLVVAPEPHRGTHRAHFFCARGVRPIAKPRPEGVEQIELRLLSPSELLDAVDRGEIEHGVHVGAILLAARRGYF